MTPPEPIRLFLVTDALAHRPTLVALAHQLRELEALAFDVVILDPTAGSVNLVGKTQAKDLREGDVLVFLAAEQADAKADAHARQSVEQALERQLIVFPVLLPAPVESLRSAWCRALPEQLGCDHLPATASPLAPEALAERLLGRLLPRLSLGLLQTDWQAQLVAPDSADRAILALRRETPEDEDAHRERQVAELCRQAERALEARLFEVATDCLRRATRFDPTDRVLAFWCARVLLATNRSHNFAEALTAATRAARLARVDAGDTAWERAAWMLAVRIAHTAANESAALEYLGEAMTGALGSRDWLEIARRHAEMDEPHRAIAALEEAFYLDVGIFEAALKAREFTFLASDLKRLTRDLHARLRAQVDTLLETESSFAAVVAEHLPDFSSPEPVLPDAAAAPGDDIFALVRQGQESTFRQMQLLVRWASRLVVLSSEHREIRTRIALLPTTVPELPAREGWNGTVHRWWPTYRRHWAELEAVIAEQARRRQELRELDRSHHSALRDGLRQFLAAVDRFEGAALADPLFAPAAPLSQAASGDLVVYPETHDADARLDLDLEMLPEELLPYAPAKPHAPHGASLYRLEPFDEGLAGSRAGVYFQASFKQARSA